jgi:hypothetical protein
VDVILFTFTGRSAPCAKETTPKIISPNMKESIRNRLDRYYGNAIVNMSLMIKSNYGFNPVEH